jgi:hypothetical protein
LRQSLPVELHQISYTLDFRVLNVSIEREAMRDLGIVKIARDTSETVNWEAPVIIIDL